MCEGEHDPHRPRLGPPSTYLLRPQDQQGVKPQGSSRFTPSSFDQEHHKMKSAEEHTKQLWEMLVPRLIIACDSRKASPHQITELHSYR